MATEIEAAFGSPVVGNDEDICNHLDQCTPTKTPPQPELALSPTIGRTGPKDKE
jgi:hypothetical protein